MGVGVLNKISLKKEKIIVLSTAHPAKFSDIVAKATKITPELPESSKNILSKNEKYKKLPKDLKNIQDYILKNV